jgi:hypothetical protein
LTSTFFLTSNKHLQAPTTHHIHGVFPAGMVLTPLPAASLPFSNLQPHRPRRPPRPWTNILLPPRPWTNILSLILPPPLTATPPLKKTSCIPRLLACPTNNSHSREEGVARSSGVAAGPKPPLAKRHKLPAVHSWPAHRYASARPSDHGESASPRPHTGFL